MLCRMKFELEAAELEQMGCTPVPSEHLSMGITSSASEGHAHDDEAASAAPAMTAMTMGNRLAVAH